MMMSKALLALLCLAPANGALRSTEKRELQFDEEMPMEEDNGGEQAAFSMTNVLNLGGEVFPRMDATQVFENKPMTDLLVLAWKALDARKWYDPLGSYQMYHIHANAPYDNAINEELGLDVLGYQGADCDRRSRQGGYCDHNSPLFLTWHRAHTALFEHRLNQEARAIAETYPEEVRETYQMAAKALRMPVVDFGSVSTATDGYPRLVGDEMITLSMDPEGNTDVEVSNPMYSYTFPITSGVDYTGQNRPAATANPLVYAKGQHSTRYPMADDTQKQNTEVAQATLKEMAQICVQPLLYELFTKNFSSYDCMGNEYATGCGEGESSYSLERIHSFGHNSMGGGQLVGYMDGAGTLTQQTPLQAFDPIFFMLHAAMDKWLTIWQYLHPDMWITPTVDLFGNYMREVNQVVDENTVLSPFWIDADKNNGEFITSAMIRDHTQLGYEYLVLADVPSKEELLERITNAYGNYALDASACPVPGGIVLNECQTCCINSLTGCVSEPEDPPPNVCAADGDEEDLAAESEVTKEGPGRLLLFKGGNAV